LRATPQAQAGLTRCVWRLYASAHRLISGAGILAAARLRILRIEG